MVWSFLFLFVGSLTLSSSHRRSMRLENVPKPQYLPDFEHIQRGG